MLHGLLMRGMSLVPRPIMRRMAGRYIAGETLQEAVARLELLGTQGYPGVLDILGEHVRDAAEARAAAEQYKRGADAIAARALDAYVSIKPTHLGLLLGEELALELYADVAAHCRELGVLVRVEMEDHLTTDATLRVFERLRARFANVGIVLQSRLLRTPDDVDALCGATANGVLDVRMVKGVYLEPESIAHTEPEPIRAAFVDCCARLWRRGARVCPATHDPELAERLALLLRELGKGPADYEFQVLMGVREDLWPSWRAAGHPVRVYVPYGPEWRAYSQRRMQRNPELFRAVLRNAWR